MTEQPDQDNTWLERTLQQARWRTDTQNTSLLLAGVIVVAVIGALYLAQASRTAAAGRRLQALEDQRELLEQQNAQLRSEIAALRSVPRLLDEAERRGYRPADTDDVIYMDLSDITAPEPVNQIVVPSSAGDVPEYDETLESWLQEQLERINEQFNAPSPDEEEEAEE